LIDNPIMTKVLILGGGFSGVGVAQHLEKYMTKKNDLEVSMVCDNNYFIFKPMLPGVAAGSIEASHIVNPIRRLCKKVHFHRASVDEIDTENKRVKIVEKDITRQHWLDYDHLVIAMGLSTDMTRVPGMSEHSLPMRTLGDAIFLRNEIINKLEMAAIESDPEVKKELLTFVFIGGGFSGVETMGEVGDMIKHAIKNYPTINKTDIQITLVHSRKRILQELGEKLALFAQKKLIKRGMELRLETRVKEVSANSVILSNNDTIYTRTVVCTTGNAPYKVLTNLDFINDKGRLDTDEHLQVVVRDGMGVIKQKIDNIWAIGDCAFTPNVKKPTENQLELCPPTAQFAVRMAPILAKNIIATENNHPLSIFKFKELGQMAVIGHLCGIAEVLGIRFSGIIAFFMWRAIYWVKLPGVYCKIRVLSDWLIHTILPIDITQLDVYRTEKVDRSHYQKGSYVFKQGDVADYFYIVEEGHVEIVRENFDGTETVLAVLNAGDSFGEMGLMQKAPRSASVRCISPVGLLKVNREDFKALTSSYSSLKTQLEKRVEEIKRSNQENFGDIYPEMAQTEQKETTTPLNTEENNISLTKKAAFNEVFEKTLSKKSPEALLELEKTIENKLSADPTNTNILKQYAEIQTHLGYLENALTVYYQYINMKPNDTHILCRMGDLHHRIKQFDKAIEVFEKAYKIEPENPFVISNLASGYRHTKQYKKAETILNEGLKEHPENSQILTLLAHCYNKQKLATKGEKVIRKQLFLTPDHIPSLIILSESLLLQSRFIDAEAFINQADTLDTHKNHKKNIEKIKKVIQTQYAKQIIAD
jgi:NADH:ubiquinone reductase (H+-translocating)